MIRLIEPRDDTHRAIVYNVAGRPVATAAPARHIAQVQHVPESAPTETEIAEAEAHGDVIALAKMARRCHRSMIAVECAGADERATMRERCAKVADGFGTDPAELAHPCEIAAAIRALR